MAPSATSSRSIYLCKHCNRKLLKKSYERHKSLYYDEIAKQWIKNSDSNLDEELELSDEDLMDFSNDTVTEDSNCVPPIVEFKDDSDHTGIDADQMELDLSDIDGS